MSISRRNFLRGVSACAVAAALPPVAVEADSGVAIAARYFAGGPIFDGSIGTYQGVVLRKGYPYLSTGALHGDLVEAAKRLAATCHPRVTPYGTFSQTILQGIEFDGC